RLADDVPRGEPARYLVMRNGAGESDSRAVSERRAQRPVTEEGEAAAAERLERPREAHDVLALGQAADADERRPVSSPPQLLARRAGVSQRRLPPARESSTASSTSLPRSRRASTVCCTNVPRSGSRGPGYICETTRIRNAPGCASAVNRTCRIPRGARCRSRP